MSKHVFDPSAFKRFVRRAKIVKPHLNDYSLYFKDGESLLWSYDRRRSIVSRIKTTADQSEVREYFIPLDRIVLLETSCDELSANVTEASCSFKIKLDGSNRSASFKTRSDSSKRPTLPGPPDASSFLSLDRKAFDFVLRTMSAASLVKSTKTDEDMRVNQVHFYGANRAAVANARYFASTSVWSALDFDASLISADIPFIRAFLADCSSVVKIGQDMKHFYLVDPDSGSYLILLKTQSNRSVYSDIDLGIMNSTFLIDTEKFKESVKWAGMTVEGTSRVTISYDGKALSILSNNKELVQVFSTSESVPFSADFPIKLLLDLSESFGDGPLQIAFLGSNISDVMLLTQTFGDVTTKHYIKSMRSK